MKTLRFTGFAFAAGLVVVLAALFGAPRALAATSEGAVLGAPSVQQDQASLALRMQIDFDGERGDQSAVDAKLTVVFPKTMAIRDLRKYFLKGEFIKMSSSWVGEAGYEFDTNGQAKSFRLIAGKFGAKFPHHFKCGEHMNSAESYWLLECQQQMPSDKEKGAVVLFETLKTLECRHQENPATGTACTIGTRGIAKNATKFGLTAALSRTVAYQLFIEDSTYLARAALFAMGVVPGFDESRFHETKVAFAKSEFCPVIAALNARFPDFSDADKSILQFPVAASVGTAAVEVQENEGIGHRDVPVVGQFSRLTLAEQAAKIQEATRKMCK
jgi:hypothetical protein